jgi:hypothetical protein
MMFNATFNNISAISWRHFIGGGKRRTWWKTWPAASHWQTLSHNGVSCTPCLSGIRTRRKSLTCLKSLTNFHIMLYGVHLTWVGFELTTLVVVGTDCIGSI